MATTFEPKDRSPLTIGFVARATIVVIGLWALANVIWLGRDVLFIAFLAMLLASFLSIFVDFLERKAHLPRVVGGPLVLLVIFGIIAGLLALTAPTLARQLREIAEQVPEGLARAWTWVQRRYTEAIETLGEPGEELEASLRERLSTLGGTVVRGALPILQSIAGAVAGVLIVVFAGLYLSIGSRLYFRGMVLLLPTAQRPRVEGSLHQAASQLRRWLLGTAINMVLVGLLTGIGLWLLGVPTAAALGVIAGLLEFVPVFGPPLAAIPAIIVALIVSPLTAVWVALLYLGVQQLESNVTTPLVMKGAIKLPPALSIFFQLLMALLFGFLGLVIAVPLLAVTIVAVRNLYVKQIDPEFARTHKKD